MGRNNGFNKDGFFCSDFGSCDPVNDAIHRPSSSLISVCTEYSVPHRVKPDRKLSLLWRYKLVDLHGVVSPEGQYLPGSSRHGEVNAILLRSMIGQNIRESAFGVPIFC